MISRALLLLLIMALGVLAVRFFTPSGPEPVVLSSRSLADMPEPREGGRLLSMNGRCYYLGGSDKLRPRDNCWRYQSTTNSWQELRPMSTSRVDMAAAGIGHKIYVFGGWLGDDIGMTDVAEVYDTQADRWDTLPRLPRKMTCAAAVSIGEDIYILGGVVGRLTGPLFFKYNIVSGTYERLPVFNQAMIYSAMVVAGDQIYALGGETDARTAQRRPYSNVYVFDAAKKEWQERSPLPIGITRSSAILRNHKIHVLGGLDADFSLGSAGLTRTHFIYDIATDHWETGVDIPVALCGLQSTLIDDQVVIFGGMLDFPRATDAVTSLIIPPDGQAGH